MQLPQWNFTQVTRVQQGGLSLTNRTPHQLAQAQATEYVQWHEAERVKVQRGRQLEQERAEFPDTRVGYRRPAGELPREQPAIGECCIRHRRMTPWRDLNPVNRLRYRAAGYCRQSSCECCAQIFGRGITSLCGCTAERENQMFCRACWDKYNADLVKPEMEIKDRRARFAEGLCDNESCACCRPSEDGSYCAHKVKAGSSLCKNCQ
jgi:hypothetical protein